MKLSAKITRNRIASTLRWIGLAALEEAANSHTPNVNPAAALGRFEVAAQRAAKLKPGFNNGRFR
jgi:hypothetical protein